MLEAGFNFTLKDKLYIWKRRQQKEAEIAPSRLSAYRRDNTGDIGTKERANRLGASKLKDLAWSLDVLDLKNQK